MGKAVPAPSSPARVRIARHGPGAPRPPGALRARVCSGSPPLGASSVGAESATGGRPAQPPCCPRPLAPASPPLPSRATLKRDKLLDFHCPRPIPLSPAAAEPRRPNLSPGSTTPARLRVGKVGPKLARPPDRPGGFSPPSGAVLSGLRRGVDAAPAPTSSPVLALEGELWAHADPACPRGLGQATPGPGPPSFREAAGTGQSAPWMRSRCDAPARPAPPPARPSCLPIWEVLWVFFSSSNSGEATISAPQLGPPPCSGSAAAEVSETEPGLGAGREEGQGHGHSHVGESNQRESLMGQTTVCPALLPLLFLPSLCLAPSSLASSGDSVPLLVLVSPSPLPPSLNFTVWLPSLLPFPFSSFFWRLPPGRRGGGKLESYLQCYGWEPMATGDWQGFVIGRAVKGWKGAERMEVTPGKLRAKGSRKPCSRGVDGGKEGK